MRARRQALPADPVEVEIRSVDERGRGVAEVDGRRVRVPGTLAGERVRVRYLRRRKREDEAEVVSVLDPAPDRIAPGCPHFHACGGCDWQHLDPDSDLRAKESRVLAALERAGVVPERVDPAIRGPRLGYRRKARLGVRIVPGKGGALVGFREKFGNRLAVLDSCAVLHPSVGPRVGELRSLVNGLDARDRVPQIEVAVGDAGAVLVFRHLDPLGASDVEHLRRFGAARGLGIALQPGGPETAAPLHGAMDLAYRLDEFAVDFRFHPLDFIQVNAPVNAALVGRAVTELRPAGRVLDLFCGIGNFTLAIAARFPAAEVIGLEGDPSLVARAGGNARRNGLGGARFQAVDLARADALAPFLEEGVDRILLDPPRSGADAALRALSPPGPERIVYVSCQPDSLARDLGWLVHGLGYRLRALAIADMFPNTSHVETIATLSRSNPGRGE